MISTINNFNTANVLIVGDLMLDRYLFGDTSRVSPEAPVPVVKVNKREDKPGGAGNVAINVVALGAKATLISVVGDDAAGDILEKELQAVGVTTDLVKAADYKTIVKERVLSQNQQLLRLDYEEALDADSWQLVFDKFEKALPAAGVVILSDYAKGILGSHSQKFIQAAKEKSIPVFVDPKHDDFSVYQQATLITPNFKEFTAAVGDCDGEQAIVDKGQALVKTYELDSLLVTRGAHGMTLIERNQPEFYLPARGCEVFDVTGAGDTVISTIATAYASGVAMIKAVEMGNAAAGIVIGKLGAATVSVGELHRALTSSHGQVSGVVDDATLSLLVHEAQVQGQRVVFTNGCFDVLHAMHVEYLALAKAQGDYLIVAVNDDASITALKGEGRPVNKLEHRMAVLAGLESVDWVIAFSDDTPCRLLETLKPDVLAKGGDYGLEGVVGADIVAQYGGEVVVLGGVADGVKSTAIIERMRKLNDN